MDVSHLRECGGLAWPDEARVHLGEVVEAKRVALKAHAPLRQNGGLVRGAARKPVPGCGGCAIAAEAVVGLA